MIGVDFPHGLAHRLGQTHRLDRRSDHYSGKDAWTLTVRHIHLRFFLFLDQVLLRVAHHADDGPSGVVINQLDLLSNRILVRPELAGHCLVDNENGWCVCLVPIAEKTTGDERYSDRFEIIGCRRIEHNLRFGTLRWEFAIGKNYRRCATVPTERKAADQGNGFYSRDFPDSIHDLPVKIPLSRRVAILAAR